MARMHCPNNMDFYDDRHLLKVRRQSRINNPQHNPRRNPKCLLRFR